jgi:hypothetical protein
MEQFKTLTISIRGNGRCLCHFEGSLYYITDYLDLNLTTFILVSRTGWKRRFRLDWMMGEDLGRHLSTLSAGQDGP